MQVRVMVAGGSNRLQINRFCSHDTSGPEAASLSSFLLTAGSFLEFSLPSPFSSWRRTGPQKQSVFGRRGERMCLKSDAATGIVVKDAAW